MSKIEHSGGLERAVSLCNRVGQVKAARQLGINPATMNKALKDAGYVKVVQYIHSDELAREIVPTAAREAARNRVDDTLLIMADAVQRGAQVWMEDESGLYLLRKDGT